MMDNELRLTTHDLEDQFIMATNAAIEKLELEFIFQGHIVPVESALEAIKEIKSYHTIH